MVIMFPFHPRKCVTKVLMNSTDFSTCRIILFIPRTSINSTDFAAVAIIRSLLLAYIILFFINNFIIYFFLISI